MLKSENIGEKEKFSIAKVSQLTLVPKHTLRYWEDEVKILRPMRSVNGKRVYCRKDIETIFKIKNLLYNERYTLEGVKKYFIKNKKKSNHIKTYDEENISGFKLLDDIKIDLEYILKLLGNVE